LGKKDIGWEEVDREQGKIIPEYTVLSFVYKLKLRLEYLSFRIPQNPSYVPCPNLHVAFQMFPLNDHTRLSLLWMKATQLKESMAAQFQDGF
jgi:hypothetical protein